MFHLPNGFFNVAIIIPSMCCELALWRAVSKLEDGSLNHMFFFAENDGATRIPHWTGRSLENPYLSWTVRWYGITPTVALSMEQTMEVLSYSSAHQRQKCGCFLRTWKFDPRNWSPWDHRMSSGSWSSSWFQPSPKNDESQLESSSQVVLSIQPVEALDHLLNPQIYSWLFWISPILVGFDPSPSRFSQGCSPEQQVGLWARYGQNMLCSKQLHPLVVVLAM